MYIKLFVSFIILLATVRGEKAEATSCNEIPRKDIESHLSTKTPYRVVANFNDEPQQYEGCQPRRMWSVIRHGARNPSKKIIKQAKRELSAIRDGIVSSKDIELCPEHLTRFNKWQFNISTEEEKFLVAEGEDELIELGERMQKRFPTLLPKDYDPEMYYFKYTATQRTLKSAQSFATGLFGRHRIQEIVYPKPLHKDPVLRACPPGCYAR